MATLTKRELSSQENTFSLPANFLTIFHPKVNLPYPRYIPAQNGFIIETEKYTLRFEDSAQDVVKDIVMITQRNVTRRYHLNVAKGSFGKYNGLESLLRDVMRDNKLRAQVLTDCRFKISVNDRFFQSSGRNLATGLMSDDPSTWKGQWEGSVWRNQVGEDFSKFLLQNFELNWAHKVVCQRRGHYQFLPNVALFFDSREELVLKLVNRPNDRDSCEGIYVGKLFGKSFGYHIDGLHTKIPEIDRYVTSSIEDIIHRSLEPGELVTERFAVDAVYDYNEDRWSLYSTVGEIGHLVKGVVPGNTCDIRKHVTWTHTVFGDSVKDVPLLESLLIESFYRAYQRPSAHYNL